MSDKSQEDASQENGGRSRLRPRLLVVAGTVVVLAAIVVALAAKSGTDSSPPTAAKTAAGALIDPKEASTAPDFNIDTLLGGIPQSGTFLGSPTAPVTLQYFSDVFCPPSREIATGPLVSIIRRWVRPGLLRIEFRSIEEGPDTEPEAFVDGQVDALAAGRQNKLWNYLEYYYSAQFENLDEVGSGTYIDTCHPLAGLSEKAARGVPGLNVQLWRDDLRDPTLGSEVTADVRSATKAELENPGYLIARTGTSAAVTLSRFSRIDPAYSGVVHELLTAVVQL